MAFTLNFLYFHTPGFSMRWFGIRDVAAVDSAMSVHSASVSRGGITLVIASMAALGVVHTRGRFGSLLSCCACRR